MREEGRVNAGGRRTFVTAIMVISIIIIKKLPVVIEVAQANAAAYEYTPSPGGERGAMVAHTKQLLSANWRVLAGAPWLPYYGITAVSQQGEREEAPDSARACYNGYLPGAKSRRNKVQQHTCADQATAIRSDDAT